MTEATGTRSDPGSGTSIVATASERPPEIPDCIGSSAGKLVYLWLAGSGETSVEELRECLGMKRIELFGILATLASRGVVEQVGAGTYRAA